MELYLTNRFCIILLTGDEFRVLFFEKYHIDIHYLISKTGAKTFKGIDPKTVVGGDPKTAADDHDAQAGTKRKFKFIC